MIKKYSKSLYKRESGIVSNSGNKIKDDYMLKYKNDGGVYLKKTGETDVYKVIQANKVNCDLQSVLETCVHQNQLNVNSPDVIKSAIADFTGLETMAEWYAGIKDFEQMWRDTPIDVKEQFNSSKAMFISSIGDDDFIDKVNTGFDKYYKGISKRIDVKSPIVDNNNIVPNDKGDINPNLEVNSEEVK